MYVWLQPRPHPKRSSELGALLSVQSVASDWGKWNRHRQMPLLRNPGKGPEYSNPREIEYNYMPAIYPGRTIDSATVVYSKPSVWGLMVAPHLPQFPPVIQHLEPWHSDQKSIWNAQQTNLPVTNPQTHSWHHYLIDHKPSPCFVILILSWLQWITLPRRPSQLAVQCDD